MRRITLFLVAAAAMGGAIALVTPGAGHADQEIYVTEIPSGYRDWKLVSVAHEAGALNDIRAILGNDLAVRAYREGKLPFPDGAIIARIAWAYVPSDENNKIFGRDQSFVAGPPPDWYLQFMVKDSKKYAATGGWERSARASEKASEEDGDRFPPRADQGARLFTGQVPP